MTGPDLGRDDVHAAVGQVIGDDLVTGKGPPGGGFDDLEHGAVGPLDDAGQHELGRQELLVLVHAHQGTPLGYGRFHGAQSRTPGQHGQGIDVQPQQFFGLGAAFFRGAVAACHAVDDARARAFQPDTFHKAVEHGFQLRVVFPGQPAQGQFITGGACPGSGQQAVPVQLGEQGTGQEGGLLVGKGHAHDVGGADARIDTAELRLPEVGGIVAQDLVQAGPGEQDEVGLPGGGPEDALLRQAVAALGRGHHDGRADAQLLPGLLQPLAQQIVPALVGGRIFQQQSYAQGRGLAGRSRQDGGETKNGQQDGQAQQPGDIKAFFHVRLPAAY